jgi:hypothetical protein
MLASSQKVWEQFMDDDFFIGLLDGLSKVMDKVGTIIESFRGL